MEFLELRMIIVVAAYMLIVGCNTEEICSYTLLEYKIGDPVAIDSMKIDVKEDEYFINIGNVNTNIHFEIREDIGSLIFIPENCSDGTIIALKVGEVKDINCKPMYPFIGERITILDKKEYIVENYEYTIFKIFNEIGVSNLKSSTMFWVQNHGIIMVKLNQGRYLVAEGWKPKLIKEIKQDVDFSELWPIPATPPAPNNY